MQSPPSWTRLLLCNLLVPISILIFALGFFPYKPFIAGSASFRNGSRPEAPFDKVVFMVVDALRSDFVYGNQSAFAFTQSLIRAGHAVPFTAHATSPTITMPRVKAMTTGSAPSFLDVILNFAESDSTSSLARQDTWLSQLRGRPGGKLVMYGDDTWLKLFPDTFSRTDGTTSFFVSDFTEVDNNVTRNIMPELQRDDWNGMVLHYLGLDHIGHKTGPRGPNMQPKQQEMDHIVELIYGNIKSKTHLGSTLLILAGDHGMNDAGNHGGSAEGETSPALVFISPKFSKISKGLAAPILPSRGDFGYHTTVEQSDIAPTLAALLGFPVPLNNLGVVIPDILPMWNLDERVQLLKENAHQMLEIIKGIHPSVDFESFHASSACSGLSGGDRLKCLWLRATSQHSGNQSSAIVKLLEFCNYAQEEISGAATSYDMNSLGAGIALAALASLILIQAIWAMFATSVNTSLWICLLTGVYGVMMFASSYVEEEQHFWYWASSMWITWLHTFGFSVQRLPTGFGSHLLSFILSQTGFRLLRRWNQTGQKHAGEPDIARTLLPGHAPLLWMLVFASYGLVSFNLGRTAKLWSSRRFAYLIATVLGLEALTFKIAFTMADAPELLSPIESFLTSRVFQLPLVLQAQFLFVGLCIFWILSLAYAFFARSEDRSSTKGIATLTHHALTLFLLTQTRTTNIPVFLIFYILHQAINSLNLSVMQLSLTCLLLQHATFFALGGSNAISSIDLSNAYNGVSGYNVGFVGILTFVGNWAGPIWWTSATSLSLLRHWQSQRQPSDAHFQTKMIESSLLSIYRQHIAVLTLFSCCATASVMVACMALRTHLFIWTVFSPKYLYTMAWNLGQQICVNVGLTGFMLWLGSWS